MTDVGQRQTERLTATTGSPLSALPLHSHTRSGKVLDRTACEPCRADAIAHAFAGLDVPCDDHGSEG